MSTSNAFTLTNELEAAKGLLRVLPDFPKKGINFVDIFPLFQSPEATAVVIDHIVDHIRSKVPESVDVVVGLDARGFLFGPMVAQKLNAGFAPVRKLGKLPGLTAQVSYAKEYGEDIFEMQSGALKPGQTVVVLDDLIATGGSAAAAGQLVQKLGGRVAEYVFMVELDGLDGYKSLDGPVYSVFHFPA